MVDLFNHFNSVIDAVVHNVEILCQVQLILKVSKLNLNITKASWISILSIYSKKPIKSMLLLPYSKLGPCPCGMGHFFYSFSFYANMF